MTADPRHVGFLGSGIRRLGAPLRDAAVDPRPDDFLVPTNAGRPGPVGNPHSTHVVAPEALEDRRPVASDFFTVDKES